MRRFFTLAVMTTVVGMFCGSFNLPLRGQQPQPQAQPGPAPQTGRGGGRNANNEAVVGAFRTNCAGCHGGGQVPNAPDLAVLRQMSPEKIYRAMTTGTMQAMAKNLTDQQKISIAESLTGRRLTEGDTTSAAVMKNRCTSNPLLGDTAIGPCVEWMEPVDWQHAVAIVQYGEALSRPGFALEGSVGLWCTGRNLHV